MAGANWSDEYMRSRQATSEWMLPVVWQRDAASSSTAMSDPFRTREYRFQHVQLSEAMA
jgi:hypothetical protein